jgi:hypothetical protein
MPIQLKNLSNVDDRRVVLHVWNKFRADIQKLDASGQPVGDPVVSKKKYIRTSEYLLQHYNIAVSPLWLKARVVRHSLNNWLRRMGKSTGSHAHDLFSSCLLVCCVHLIF